MSDVDNNLPIVAIVGTGNVATHLSQALCGKVTLHLVNPHTSEGMPDHADIVILSVKDNAIESVITSLPRVYDLIAHTSGSVPMDVLSECGTDYGVFYPLQTFTKEVPLNYSEIPFFVEGNSQKSQEILLNLATKISPHIYLADSESRKTLHLASVFACNFSNCLIGIADKILQESDLNYRILLPLLKQTIAKLENLPPEEAQTGPASRKDFNVIDSHINLLEKNGHHDWAELYKLITNQIITNKL